jgi:hypothetical protein
VLGWEVMVSLKPLAESMALLWKITIMWFIRLSFLLPASSLPQYLGEREEFCFRTLTTGYTDIVDVHTPIEIEPDMKTLTWVH